MRIDWITVAAQVVNFLILVYLLRRFLYRPVVRAMERREQAIAERLQQAAQREQSAAQEAESLRLQNEAFTRERTGRLAEVEREAETLRQQLLTELQQEMEARRAQWQAELAREQQDRLRRLTPRLHAALLQAVRGALKDLADADLERQMVAAFTRRLQALDADQTAALRASAQQTARLRVTTHFDLGADTREHLRQTLLTHLLDGQPATIDFQRGDHLLGGIEVDTDGRQIAWTLDEYLQDLADALAHPGPHPSDGTDA